MTTILSWMTKIKNRWKEGLQHHFPPLCLSCQRVILQHSERICANVKVKFNNLVMKSKRENRCFTALEKTLYEGQLSYFCEDCINDNALRLLHDLFVPLEDDVFDQNKDINLVLVPFRYQPPFPSVIRRLKFAEEWELAKPLGELIYLSLLGVQAAFSSGYQLFWSKRGEFSWQKEAWIFPGWRLFFNQEQIKTLFLPDYILPLPLHPDRLAERGYNQAACIAQSLAHCLTGATEDLYRDDLLLRLKNTKRQSEQKDKIDRLENLKDAFYCPDLEALRGKKVYLIDDVLTTGTTLKEATDTLKKAGVSCVIAFAVASNRLVEKSPVNFCG